MRFLQMLTLLISMGLLVAAMKVFMEQWNFLLRLEHHRRLSLVVAEREMRFIGSCSEKTFRSMPAFYKKMIWIIRLQKHSPQKLLQRKRLNPLENLLFKKQVRYYNIVSE